jgi:hypothetical protein
MSRAPQRIIDLAHLLKPVRNEVIGLLFNRYVFRTLQEIGRRNKRLQGQPRGKFSDWSQVIYAVATSVAIRRLASENYQPDDVSLGFFAVTATSAVEGLIAGVVERSLAGVDFRLAVGLGTSGRIPDGDPLGIALETSSHDLFLLSPASAPAAGRAALHFHHRATCFRAGLSNRTGGPCADSSDARSGALHGRDKRSGRREPMARTC